MYMLVSQYMRFLSFFLLFGLLASAPLVEAQWSNSTSELSPKEKRKKAKQEAKQARKEAVAYYKDYIVKKRRAYLLVKNVEEEKDVARILKGFRALYETAEKEENMNGDRVIGGGSSCGNGGVEVSEEAKKKAMDAERKKYEKHIKKIDNQIETEKARIEEAGLMTDELKEMITKALE